MNKKEISYFEDDLLSQVNKFKIEEADIGQIQKIRIGHNSEKIGSAWYLEKVRPYLIFF